MRSDSNHGVINMNQHHHQEDSKDSLIIQQQVQHQDMLDQHQQQDLQQDDEASIPDVILSKFTLTQNMICVVR